MKQRQNELTKVEEELKRRTREILELQLKLQDAEKILVRLFPYVVCECFEVFVTIGTCSVPWSSKA